MRSLILTLLFLLRLHSVAAQEATAYSTAFEKAMLGTKGMDRTSYDFTICAAVRNGDSVVTNGTTYRDESAFLFYSHSNDATSLIDKTGIVMINHHTRSIVVQAFQDTSTWRKMKESMGSAAIMDQFLDSMVLKDYRLRPGKKTRTSHTLRADYPELSFIHNLSLTYRLADTALESLQYETWRNGNGAPTFSEGGSGFIRQTISMSGFRPSMPSSLQALIHTDQPRDAILTKTYPQYTLIRKTVAQ